jgi:hypothetical protein
MSREVAGNVVFFLCVKMWCGGWIWTIILSNTVRDDRRDEKVKKVLGQKLGLRAMLPSPFPFDCSVQYNRQAQAL